MIIDREAIARELDRLEDYRVEVIAQLAAAQAACDDPALEENFALHRTTWIERKQEVKRLEQELIDVNDDMLQLITARNSESDGEYADPMDVHETPYTTGYYGN